MAKAGQLTIEVDWLKKNLQKCLDPTGRLNLVSKNDKLSVAKQTELLDVNRTSFYYTPVELDGDGRQLLRIELTFEKFSIWCAEDKDTTTGARRT